MPCGSVYVQMYTLKVQHIEKIQHQFVHSKREHPQKKTVTQRETLSIYRPHSTSLPLPSLVITFLLPLQVADSSPQCSYLQRKISQRLFFVFWLLFSNNNRPYSGSVAPVTCSLCLT
jgi:hypothetical protein